MAIANTSTMPNWTSHVLQQLDIKIPYNLFHCESTIPLQWMATDHASHRGQVSSWYAQNNQMTGTALLKAKLSIYTYNYIMYRQYI